MAEAAPAVAFLRAVNVGGHALRPADLARDLGTFHLENHGAAGTFVSYRPGPPGALERAIARSIPYPTEVTVLPVEQLADLVRARPFGRESPEPNVGWYVTVLARPTPSPPRLPIQLPEGGSWMLRVERLVGQLVLSRRRLNEPGRFYPNEVIEKAFDLPATTRGWPTILAIVAKAASVAAQRSPRATPRPRPARA